MGCLLGVGRGESGKALSACRDEIEGLHDGRDELLMRFHVDDAGRRQPARGLKVSHPLLGCRPEITVDRDGEACLLYTSDAADERSSVDLGGRRIIKKKK